MIRTRITFAYVSMFMVMVVMTGPPAPAQKYAPGGAKVYFLTGGKRQHHGYRDQAFYLAETLENTGRYEVTLGEDAAILETPALRKYDLIIANADRRDPEFRYTKAQQEALLNFVKSGGGYVSIHGADNAPDDWVPDFKVMLGGVFSHFGLPDGKTKKGEYTVKIADRASPITAGLSDFRIKDELYYHMQIPNAIKPLATVEYQGAEWPVAWTNIYGTGRVFHLVFGHRDFGPSKDDPVRDPNLGKLLIQGVDWVANGKKRN